ncbi:MAG: SIS domain-containing protein [Epsilonproteobacteria bacterium]|nr:SIS domain-containing protein [Campylobacterota bacterium]
MLQELTAWPDKLQAGQDLAYTFFRSYQKKMPKDVTKVVFVGMGGSGIVGRIAKTFLDRSTNIISTVLDGSKFPGWVDDQTFAIVMSYSGNTWETNQLFDQLLKRSVPCVVLAHGGVLEQKSAEYDIPFALLPASLTPRSALGNFLGFVMELFDLMGVLPGKAYLQAFKSHAAQLIPKFSKRHFFDDFLPIVEHYDIFQVWGVTGDSDVAAYRAQTQFNENAKVLALHASFPELAHNVLEGFSGLREKAFVIFAHTQFLPDNLSVAVKAVDKVLQQKGSVLYKVPILGDTFEKQFYNIILWSDFASIYLGQLKNLDVVSVPTIESFKKEQKQQGVNI